MKRKMFFIALGFLILIAAGYFHFRSGIELTIANNTSQTLPGVSFSYTSGGTSLSDLKSKSSFRQRINPTSESDLILNWTVASGQTHSKNIDVYMEHNYRGWIKIVIDANSGATWTAKIKTPYDF